MSLFSSLIRRATRAPAAAQAATVSRPRVPSNYTPHDPGIPVVSIDEILEPHQDLMQRIHLAYGAPEERCVLHIDSVVRRYAQYVHLLPATASNFFSEQGGLLRMGLEVGFFSLQASDSVIFEGRQTVTHRMHLEPRWRYATFLAGLLSEVHRVFSQLNVTSGDDGTDWPAYLLPLTTWCQQRTVDRYYLRWSPRPLEARAQGLFVAPYILEPKIMDYLSDSNTSIVPHLLGCISGIPSHREANVIDSVVRRCAAGVIDRYIAATASRYGKPIVGAHVERYLVDAMQRLVIKGAWLINVPKTRLWYGADGMFLVWPGAANDIVKLLEKDHLPGIPKSPDSIAHTLVDAHAFTPNDQGGFIWIIKPPEATEPVPAVKLTTPLMLLSSLADPPQPLSTALHVPSRVLTPASAPSAVPPPHSVSAPVLSPAGEQRDDVDEDDSTAFTYPDPAVPQSTQPPSPSPESTAEPPPPSTSPQGAQLALPVSRDAVTLAPIPRLSRTVIAGLRKIVATLGSDVPACSLGEDGLFIPLRQLDAHGLDAATTVRTLHEENALVMHGKTSKTHHREFGGKDVLGIVIPPRFLVPASA